MTSDLSHWLVTHCFLLLQNSIVKNSHNLYYKKNNGGELSYRGPSNPALTCINIEDKSLIAFKQKNYKLLLIQFDSKFTGVNIIFI